MAEYNGHSSWAAWNVSLWINNDENLYNRACDLVNKYGHERAARFLHYELKGDKTPDGASYSKRSVKAAIRGIERVTA